MNPQQLVAMNHPSSEFERHLKRLRWAFEDCKRPEPYGLISVGGIDWPDAHSRFADLDRAGFLARESLTEELLKLLDNLGSDGRRYFMPVVFEKLLREPEVLTPWGFEMFTKWLTRCVKPGRRGDSRYYGIAWSPARIDGVRRFLKLLPEAMHRAEPEIRQEVDVESWIVEISGYLDGAESLEDFDLE